MNEAIATHILYATEHAMSMENQGKVTRFKMGRNFVITLNISLIILYVLHLWVCFDIIMIIDILQTCDLEGKWNSTLERKR